MKERPITTINRCIDTRSTDFMSTTHSNSSTAMTLPRPKIRIKRLRQNRHSNLLLSLAVVVLVIASNCPVEGSPRSICLRNCHLCQQVMSICKSPTWQSLFVYLTFCVKIYYRQILNIIDFKNLRIFLNFSNLEF